MLNYLGMADLLLDLLATAQLVPVESTCGRNGPALASDRLPLT